MRLSPASDGNNSKYVLEVVGLINNQKVVELLSSTEWQMYNHLVTRCGLVTRLQPNCRSAAEQGGEELTAPRGGRCCLVQLVVKKPRRSQEACVRQCCCCCCWAHGILNPLTAEGSHWALTAQTGVHYAPLHFHCVECFPLYRRRLESQDEGKNKIVTFFSPVSDSEIKLK